MRLWLWIVQPNPQGWSQGWRWALVGILMVVVWGVGMGHPVFGTGAWETSIIETSYVRRPDGSWRAKDWTDGDQMVALQFAGVSHYQRGLGWERWRVGRGVPRIEYISWASSRKPTNPSALLTPAQMENAWSECFQREIDDINQDPSQIRRTIACSLLRDGRTELYRGWAAYAVYTACGPVGVGLIVLAFTIGVCRVISGNVCVNRIHRVRDGVCPRCQYPFPAGTKPVCSECGLDIAADDRATRERMGEPVEDVVGPRGEEIDEGVLDASWVDDERVWGGAGGEEGPSGNDSVQGAGR